MTYSLEEEQEAARADTGDLRTLPTIAVRLRRLRTTLLVAAAVLTLASLGVQLSRHVLGHGQLHGITEMFDMNKEGNLPTLFGTLLLLACSATLALIWLAARSRADGEARYWAGLALLFAAAAVDEAVGIHEVVGSVLSGGDAVFAYLIPGTLLLLGVGIAMGGFVSRLPRPTRRALAWGLAIWTFGAVGLEVVEAIYWPGDYRPRFGLSLLGTFQDLFEMLGLIVILDALLRYASEHANRTVIRFAP